MGVEVVLGEGVADKGDAEGLAWVHEAGVLEDLGEDVKAGFVGYGVF